MYSVMRMRSSTSVLASEEGGARSKMEPIVFVLLLLLIAPLEAKKQKKLEIITEVHCMHSKKKTTRKSVVLLYVNLVLCHV